MSDTDITPAQDQDSPAQDETTGQDDTQQQSETDWQVEATRLRDELAKARKWEQRAKENKDAASELAKLREAQMSESERAEARVKAAEERAHELEAANDRKDVAIEYRLSPDDAALLDDLTDPDAMKRLAARLARQAEEEAGPRSPRPDPNQGRNGGAVASTEDQFVAFANKI